MTYASQLARLSDMFSAGQGVPFANRNYIIDGNFDSWTSAGGALSTPGTSYVGPTMYASSAGVGGAASISQGGLTGNEPLGMTTPVALYVGWNQTTASTGSVAAQNAPLMVQRIESVRTLNGRSSTFSCWLWATAPITITAVRASQSFGAGGSPSAGVFLDKTVNWALTTTPQRFSVRLDWPSINGKTLGTSNDLISVGLWLPGNVTFNISTAQWQLEQSSPNSSSDLNGKGGAPTVFEYRGAQAEAARVQRQYQSGINVTVRAYAAAAAATYDSNVSWPAMRGTPATSIGTAGGSVNCTNSGLLGVSNSGARAEIVANAAGDAYIANYFYVLDSRL